MKYSIEELKAKKEDQLYDRKSARKDPKGLSNHIIAFANADGGTLAIGIEDNGEITGIDDYTQNVNEILRVPFDFCKPSVLVETETVDCIDVNGKANHLLLITIPQSPELHANQQDDVYYRMGDKSQKLSFDDRLLRVHAIMKMSRLQTLLLMILIWILWRPTAVKLGTQNHLKNISSKTNPLLLPRVAARK